MWIPVLFIAAAVTTASGQLTIYSRQFAEGLNITCEYTNDTRNNLSYAVSLVISRYTDGQDLVLASINSFRTIVNHVTDAKVTGHMNGSYYFDSNITIHWANASHQLNGNYSCTLYGLDPDNEERGITQKLILQLEDTDPAIRATPSHIVDGYTPCLIVDCSLTNLVVYDNSELLQIEISHVVNGSGQLIARLNGTNQPTVSATNQTSVADGWEVISSYFKARSAYLAVKRLQPTTKESGVYTCDVSTSNSTTPIVKSTSVTASVSSKQYVYDSLTDQESLQEYYLFACNFEHGLCGLNLSGPSNLTSWTLMPDRLRGQGLHYGNPWQVFGHYLYLDAASLHSDNEFTIETKMIPPIRRSICVSFWLLVTGNIRGVNMYTRQHGVLYNFYTHAGFFDGPWQFIENMLPPIDQPFTVVIQAKGSFVLKGFVAIDDIIITDLNCH